MTDWKGLCQTWRSGLEKNTGGQSPYSAGEVLGAQQDSIWR